MLDTNIISNLMRDVTGAVRRKMDQVGQDALCISVISAAEIRFGIARRDATTNRRRFEQLLERIPVLPFDSPADDIYGALRSNLERRGQLIGALDMLIAAHALATECVLVTDNVREFSRVPNLHVENWLRPED